MSDEMINKSTKIGKDQMVDGIGDTVFTHYNEHDMNVMNNPINGDGKSGKPDTYSKGQSKQREWVDK